MDEIISLVVSLSIPSVIAVIGWFVLDFQNRKMRIEEAMRSAYYKLLSDTNKLLVASANYRDFISRSTMEFEGLIVEINKANNPDKRQEKLDIWKEKVENMIGRTYAFNLEINSSTRLLDLGGTDFGGDSKVYKALMLIVLDANQSLLRIVRLWVNYINMYDMNAIQFSTLKNDTSNELKQIDELCGCLNDVMIHAYNNYISKSLKLKKREIEMSSERRYIMSDGRLEDRRTLKA